MGPLPPPTGFPLSWERRICDCEFLSGLQVSVQGLVRWAGLGIDTGPSKTFVKTYPVYSIVE